MEVIYYISSAIAILSTAMVITRLNALHALLYLVLSLLSVAVIFFTLGAPFLAALEIIIYAGAIMVLFVFVVMMLNLGGESVKFERQIVKPRIWILPVLLAIILLAEIAYMIMNTEVTTFPGEYVGAADVGQSLFTKYAIAVELAAIMLLAAVVGAYHLGRKKQKTVHRYLEQNQSES